MKVLVVGALVTLFAIAAIGYATYARWFAPKESTPADAALPDLGKPSAKSPTGQPGPLRSGRFQGADDFHFARGTVAL